MDSKRKQPIDWSDVQHSAPEWFRDAKFGLFFH